MSPEKGGVLRTEVRRAFRRSLLVMAAVALPVAPMVALGASTGRVHVAPAATVSAPSQQPLAASVPTTTLLHETVSQLMRHYVILPKRVHHVVHRAPSAPRVLHHVVVHHKVRPHPRHIVIPHRFHRIGIATWYNWHPGQCATSYLPHGTRIWITDLDTGRVISCVVTDTQAYDPNRVVDLSETQFAQLAPLSKGIIRVKVTW